MRADENLREYTLRQLVVAATNFTLDLANQKKIAKDENDKLANQTTLSLFEFVHKTKPFLASMYCGIYV